MLHNTPGDQQTVQNYPVISQRCKAVAQTRTSRLAKMSINLHPQQVTVELLVELGKMYLPDAAKAQLAIDRWGAHQDAVRHKVDSERPEELLHDQAHPGHIRTDLRGPGILRVKGGRITDSGQPVTSITIPFASLRGAWVQDSDMKWHRLIVPTGHEQIIRTVHRPWQFAGRDQVLREARLCAENVGSIDSEAAEIIDIVTAFENRKIKLGGEEEKANHAKLLRFVIFYKVVEISGRVVCPACLRATPVKYSICLRCIGMNDDVTRGQTCGNHFR